ncbi:hypothetical protein WA158_000600 [Blastocystis sp. Blastoise]
MVNLVFALLVTFQLMILPTEVHSFFPFFDTVFGDSRVSQHAPKNRNLADYDVSFSEIIMCKVKALSAFNRSFLNDLYNDKMSYLSQDTLSLLAAYDVGRFLFDGYDEFSIVMCYKPVYTYIDLSIYCHYRDCFQLSTRQQVNLTNSRDTCLSSYYSIGPNTNRLYNNTVTPSNSTIISISKLSVSNSVSNDTYIPVNNTSLSLIAPLSSSATLICSVSVIIPYNTRIMNASFVLNSAICLNGVASGDGNDVPFDDIMPSNSTCILSDTFAFYAGMALTDNITHSVCDHVVLSDSRTIFDNTAISYNGVLSDTHIGSFKAFVLSNYHILHDDCFPSSDTTVLSDSSISDPCIINSNCVITYNYFKLANNTKILTDSCISDPCIINSNCVVTYNYFKLANNTKILTDSSIYDDNDHLVSISPIFDKHSVTESVISSDSYDPFSNTISSKTNTSYSSNNTIHNESVLAYNAIPISDSIDALLMGHTTVANNVVNNSDVSNVSTIFGKAIIHTNNSASTNNTEIPSVSAFSSNSISTPSRIFSSDDIALKSAILNKSVKRIINTISNYIKSTNSINNKPRISLFRRILSLSPFNI